MANKSLFTSSIGKLTPKTDTLNEAGAPAYAFSAQHALAQYASTGCLNATYYATAEKQLDKVLTLCSELDPLFIAKTAIYCRERGTMKDMPALLCAVLAVKDSEMLKKIFPRVIDNGKMLRNFVQIMRSGVVNRKSLGTVSKRLVQEWLDKRTDEQIFSASVGNAPSLADIIKMVHPKPKNKSREALYAYLIGRDEKQSNLPEVVLNFEKFKNTKEGDVSKVPFQMLTGLPLEKKDWINIAKNASWQMTRMNLNTFLRHGIFEEVELTEIIANRLRNETNIKQARALPYQLMVAYKMAENVPLCIREALQDAMEIATQNVPQIDGNIFICPDVSGSMNSPVTGYREGSTTTVRCTDVAALVTASIMRKNPNANVLPFECEVVPIKLNPRDSVMTNAEKLASIGGGGTNCSAPLKKLNSIKAIGDLIVFISDNESWVDTRCDRKTETMVQWECFKQRNPKSKMICIDIQPYSHTQAAENVDILNIGGFSDNVFDLLQEFATGKLHSDHWVGVIDRVEI